MKQPWFFSFLILLVFIVSFGLRLNALSVPVGISHDELDYVLNAKWLLLTGSDLSQTWQPWRLEPIKTSTLTAELTPVVYAMFLQFLPFTLTGVRVMTAFLSSLLPLVVMLWMVGLKLDRRWVLLSGLLLALNPWSMVFSHTGYEAPLSLMFHVLGLAAIVWLTRSETRTRQLLWLVIGFIALGAGFYTYHGYKVLTLPLVVVQVGWLWWMARNKLATITKIQLASLLLWAVILTVQLVGLRQGNLSDRSGEILPFNADHLSEIVNSERRQALDSRWQGLFSNKMVVLVHEMSARYLDAISLKSWFLAGDDNSKVLAIWRHGFFYSFELIFLLIGAAFLIKHKQKVGWLLLCLLLLSPLPSAIQLSFSHTFRSALIVPLVSVVAAYGLHSIWKEKYGNVLVLLASILYIGGLANFMYFYTQTYPVITAELFVWKERLLSEYVSRLPKDQQILVLAEEPYHLARAYVFYQTSVSPESVATLSETFSDFSSKALFEIENVVFTDDCSSLPATSSGVVAIFEPSLLDQCKIDQEQWQMKERLAAPIDSRDYFKVSGKSLCQSFPNPQPFVRAQQISDFNLNEMKDQQLCETWSIVN